MAGREPLKMQFQEKRQGRGGMLKCWPMLIILRARLRVFQEGSGLCSLARILLPEFKFRVSGYDLKLSTLISKLSKTLRR
jgi:hypothetical protein